jgi:hypothetical protein
MAASAAFLAFFASFLAFFLRVSRKLFYSSISASRSSAVLVVAWCVCFMATASVVEVTRRVARIAIRKVHWNFILLWIVGDYLGLFYFNYINLSGSSFK